MQKIAAMLLCVLTLCSCKDDGTPTLDSPTFPFMKVGNQWNYWLVTEEGQTEVSYKIADKTKESYFKVLLQFVEAEFPPVEHFWYADQTSFAMATDWPDSPLKLPMLKKGCKVGDRWSFDVPASPDPDDLSGTLTYEIMAVNTSVDAAGTTYSDVYKIRHTATSHAEFYADYYISLSAGMIKMEGIGYVWIDGDEGGELIYFPLEWRLKSKNF
ncbi:hypothetical protein ACFSR5_18610 [Sphingobacterium suaedae]|uniref:Uncharacterized protein n=2 Tax=Sphingobacterium suaedae TaxID=1686402 RepID=A0ABW5KMY0_9SPHI